MADMGAASFDADGGLKVHQTNSSGGGGGGAATIADGADIAEGATTATVYSDVSGATAGTSIGLFKGMFVKLAAIASAIAGVLSIKQADLTATGTISAAQPVIGTPVSNATVSLTLGQGQSAWKALLTNGGGGFTSGTTIVADQSIDGGTTWIAASFKVAGSPTSSTVQSVTGPGPVEISGNGGALSTIRIRCSVLNSTETIAVTIRGGAGPGSVGIIGEAAVNLNQVNGATLSASNPVLTNDQIRALIANGQGFRATTGLITTSAGSAFVGLQAVANNLSVNAVIYNIYVTANQSTADVRGYQNAASILTDSGLTANLLSSILNQQPGSAITSALSALNGSPASTTETSLTNAGTQGITNGASANSPATMLLNNGSQIWLPKSKQNTCAAYAKITTSGNGASITFEWVEF